MTRLAGSIAAALAITATASPVSADESIIRNPGDHPSYRFEAEPHGLIGYAGPLADVNIGAGFRGTVIIVDNGFIPKINNSVGIGFGADLFFGHGTFFIPLVMQWSFWLTPHWSVFGEPGVGFAANPERNQGAVHPTAYAGARYHFNDTVSLTLRLGYPSLSVGVSFLL
jgi:hypothetical protein